MSGLNSIVLCLLIAACGSALGAQFLPDVKQFQVENARLILLDKNGNRKGVLKGKLASKQRDGRVEIEDAELVVERKRESFVLRAKVFSYKPDTHAFECSKGLTADLPNNGRLSVPAGSGEIRYADGVKLKMKAEGEARLRTGPEDEPLVDAGVASPDIDVELVPVQGDAKDDNGFEVGRVTVSGSRGGELKLRLAHMPDFSGNRPAKPAVADVSCFGDVSLSLDQSGTHASLRMLRRSSMKLKDAERTFEVTSNLLNVAGSVTQPDATHKANSAEALKAALTDLAIDASQNVLVKGDRFSGASAMLRYREYGDRRNARMEGDASLVLHQQQLEDGREPRIEMRAQEYVNVEIPKSAATTTPEQISTELFESAHVMRFLDDRLEWQINGRLVRLYSVLDRSVGRDDVYNHSFDAYAEGYSPLLRITGLPPQPNMPKLERAAVYGSRAEGSFIHGQADVTVHGPDVLGVVHSDAPLANLLRIGLGLQVQARDKDGKVIPPAPRDGRLTVRAAKLLTLQLTTAADARDVSLTADGQVQLDHEPLPRDDRNLVSLTGEFVALSLKDGAVRYAQLDAPQGEDALATLGYDLMVCRGVNVHEQSDETITELTGPGRLIIRDENSVDYFRRELNRLPKRPEELGAPPRPDAAWLNFGSNLTAGVSELAKRIEADSPEFHLVFGDFETPRAGRSAVKDIDELADSEVKHLYVIRGRHVFASSTRAARKAPAVNVLLLEGDAFVNSRIDGITARAADAIELSGSDNQKQAGAPLSAVLRRNAQLEIEDAGVFFGEYVRSGVFSYNGRWLLESAGRLEVTFRPLDAPGKDPTLLPRVRAALSLASRPGRFLPARLKDVEEATELLESVTTLPAPTKPGADQPWKAVEEARDARRLMRRALQMWVTGMSETRVTIDSAMRSVRRCRALLSSLIDVAGSGGVQGHFRSTRENVPPLDLKMRQALFTFDGLGEAIDVKAGGPIEVSRDAYTLTGTSLIRESDGTLTLDGASITLPKDTGVEVSGVQAIALKQRDAKTTPAGRQRRTMVTRVTGKELKVHVRLLHEASKQGE